MGHTHSAKSYVVTGGGRGVGRAIVERLLTDGAGVVVVERDSAAVEWMATHPRSEQLAAVVGSAADEDVCELVSCF